MKYEQLATVTAYADAKGLPYETKTKTKIAVLGGVAGELIAPDTYSPDFPDFQGQSAGTWSDDTQHTLAMMESLVEIENFDLRDLAIKLKAEMDESRAGWGGATKQAIGEVDGAMSLGELRSLGVRGSNGCGPLMRLTPLAIFNHGNPSMNDTKRLGYKSVNDSTTLTHNSAQSMIASQTHVEVLDHLIKERKGRYITNVAWYAAKRNEPQFDEEPMLSSKIGKTFNSKDLARDVYDDEHEAFTTWSVQAVTYAMYDRMRGAPFRELIDAVISEGGDTDSTAALAAGMWVCDHPDEDPGVEVGQLQQYQRLVTVGKAFAELIVSQSS